MPILWTLVLSMLVFPSVSQAQLWETFELKREAFEKLWEVSMNRLEVEELTGELHKDNWDRIRPEVKTVKEIAALIVRNDDTQDVRIINMSMGTKTSGTISFAKPQNYTVLGRFHTHPYEYESIKDLTFSPRDLVDLYTSRRAVKLYDGYFSLIRSGEKYYALVVENAEEALKGFQEQEALAKEDGKTLFDYTYKKFYSKKDGNSVQEMQIYSLIYIMVPGIGFYEYADGRWRRLN